MPSKGWMCSFYYVIVSIVTAHSEGLVESKKQTHTCVISDTVKFLWHSEVKLCLFFVTWQVFFSFLFNLISFKREKKPKKQTPGKECLFLAAITYVIRGTSLFCGHKLQDANSNSTIDYSFRIFVQLKCFIYFNVWTWCISVKLTGFGKNNKHISDQFFFFLKRYIMQVFSFSKITDEAGLTSKWFPVIFPNLRPRDLQ